MGGIIAFWLIAGILLCSLELLLPTAFVAFMMGISALGVAVISYLFAPPFLVQVILWLGTSTLMIFGVRRLLPQKDAPVLRDSVEARTLTEIPPGETGRVLYEGNSWQARCDDPRMEIAPGQRVYVVRRQGTTLIVMPENLLHP